MLRALPLLSRLAVLLAAVLLAMALARLIWLLLAGPVLELPTAASNPMSESFDDESAPPPIAGWHLFGASGPAAAPVAAPETTLRLFLRGTLSETGSGSGIAIIADANGSERGYRIGDELPGGATLRAIHAGRVELERNGRRESLSLPNSGDMSDPSSGGSSPPLPPSAAANGSSNAAPATPFVNPIMSFGAPDMQTAREKALPDLRAMASEVSVLPVLENGRMVGVRVSGKQGSDLLSRYGIQPNDVITEVNGVPLDGPQRQIELTRSLSTATQVNLTVRRDGKQLQLTLGMR